MVVLLQSSQLGESFIVELHMKPPKAQWPPQGALQTLRQKDRPIDSVGERLAATASPPKGQALHRQRESLR
jgi:hypothetical protein